MGGWPSALSSRIAWTCSVVDDRTRHYRHDPELIAALLDREASATEHAEADDRRRSCPECAALYVDLLALAEAVREVPAPARARDFALTAADADRLSAERTGEPGPSKTRLTGVLTIRPETADHAAHDTMLVASLADHSLGATERAAAEALIDTCDRCAELHTDLVSLVAATRRMPTPARPHDFALTAGQAARLRSPWRRLLDAIGSPRDALSKPLAIGLTTLGIAGLLVTSIPSMSFGSASSAGGPAAAPAASSAAGAPARVSGPVPETTGASDLSGEAATAAGASAQSVAGRGGQRERVAHPAAGRRTQRARRWCAGASRARLSRRPRPSSRR